MTQSQYLEQEVARWKKEFAQHQATLERDQSGDTVNAPSVITWKKSGTSINSIRFILSGVYLCAIGDLGDAVYQWSERITPQFLGTCEFSYMFGKVKAYPGDTKFRDWDHRVARRWAMNEANDYDTEERNCPAWLSTLSTVTDVESDREAFESAAKEVYDETGDAELASEISDAGFVPDCHAVSHWVGLQMALHQLGYRDPLGLRKGGL